MQPIIPISRKDPFERSRVALRAQVRRFSGLLYIERGTRCRFISRNGNTLTRFDALCQAVAAELDVDSVILDGEVIAADESGRPLFSTSCALLGSPPMWPSTFSGSMVLICAPCPSASAGGACMGCYPRDHRSSPKRCRFEAGTRALRAHAGERSGGYCREAARRFLRPARQVVQNQEPELFAERGERGLIQQAAAGEMKDNQSERPLPLSPYAF
jgi:hypothetical protein